MSIPMAILAMGHDRESIQDAIDAATYISRRQIERGRAPLWWRDSAVYAREEQATLPGVERIQTAEELAAMGRGDCDDHAPSLAASLQVVGIDARARVVRSPGVGYHVVVEYIAPDGSHQVIDPSARRGMLDGDAVGERRAIRRRRVKSWAKRSAELLAAAERERPASRARRALVAEAARAYARARAESSRAEELEAEDE